MDKTQKKIEILKANLLTREGEVFNYQIDIDNFERAIKKIEIEYQENPEMYNFGVNLTRLLKENKEQQSKAQLILDVIKEQLFELTGDPCFTSN